MVGGHIGVVGGHFLEHPVVQGAPERLGIAFGDQAYLRFTRLAVGAVEAARAVRAGPFGGPLPGAFERVAYQPLGGGVGEHLQLRGDFLAGTGAQAAALAHVLAFAVFADHQHIQIAGAIIGQVLNGAGVEAGGPFAGPQVQTLAQGQQRRQGDAVGETVTLRIAERPRVTQGAQQQRLVLAQPWQGVLRHHGAVAPVPVGGRPGQHIVRQGQVVAVDQRLEHRLGHGHHLRADAVAG